MNYEELIKFLQYFQIKKKRLIVIVQICARLYTYGIKSGDSIFKARYLQLTSKLKIEFGLKARIENFPF